MPIAGVVLHPDIGGLRPLFEQMADRLASHGFAVVCFDPFAALPSAELSSIDARMGAVKDLDDTMQLEIFSAAADLMVVDDDVTRISMLGFCMGGYYTFKAASTERFDAAVAFYGMLRTPDGWRGPGHRIEPLDTAAEMVPTLAFFGTNDPFTPAADIDALQSAWAGRKRLRDRGGRRRRARLRARSRPRRPSRRRRRDGVGQNSRLAPRLKSPNCWASFRPPGADLRQTVRVSARSLRGFRALRG